MGLRHIITAAAITVAGVTTTGPQASAAEVDDFRGLWYAQDHVDGSNLYLFVGPRGQVVLFDDSAFVCDGAPAIARSRPGTIDGDRLLIEFRIRCFNRISVPNFPTYLQAEPDGTLTSEPDGGDPVDFDVYTRL